MKNTILISLLFFCSIAQAQIVDIPDANFKNALVNTNCVDINGDFMGDDDVDTNDDGEIQESEAEAVLWLTVINEDISSLEGIQSFTNLVRLYCQGNEISIVDVSQSPNLEVLDCQNNAITDIDVTQNPLLEWLVCEGNLITSLDLSYNPNLEWLYSTSNQFTMLNLKNGNNINMYAMYATNNPYLTCIQVDNADYSNNAQGWFKDDIASFSEDCALNIIDFETLRFNLYPNPTNDILNIDSQLLIEKVQVYNMQGVLVKESFTKSIDVSELSSGIYFIKVSNNVTSSTMKIIKL